jgi:Na+-driven multidrug efflux pump
LRLLGADGEALHLAKQFIWIASPGFVLLAGAIACSFTLQGLGDARRGMYVTLVVAVIIAILDPIFIFGLGAGKRDGGHGARLGHLRYCLRCLGL